MFGCAGEISTLDLHTEVVVEERGHADGRVGIVDRLVLKAIDAAIDRMKIAVAAVDIDTRVDMRHPILGRLRRAEGRCAKTEHNQNQASQLGQAWH